MNTTSDIADAATPAKGQAPKSCEKPRRICRQHTTFDRRRALDAYRRHQSSLKAEAETGIPWRTIIGWAREAGGTFPSGRRARG